MKAEVDRLVALAIAKEREERYQASLATQTGPGPRLVKFPGENKSREP